MVSHVPLIIIDMQVDFFDHANLAHQRSALVTNTNALVAAARGLGSPIIWVRQELSPDLTDAPLEMRKNRIFVTIAGTPGASLLPELDVQASDQWVVKKRYSGFFGTDLDERLSNLDSHTIIVAGINTHACVRTTVIDAYQRDYEVLLARNCIASYDEEHHRVSWQYMDGKLGRGMTNSEIVALLRSRAPPA